MSPFERGLRRDSGAAAPAIEGEVAQRTGCEVIGEGQARCQVVVWLGAGRDAGTMRAAAEKLARAGASTLLFNPPGQAGETAHFSFDRAVAVLDRAIDALPPAPVVVVAHSMAAHGALHLAERRPVRHLALVAPMLDSRACLGHLHATRTTAMLAASLARRGEVRDALAREIAEPDWPERWAREGRPAALEIPAHGSMAVPSIGEFLEELFVPGFASWPLLARHRDRTSVFVTANDEWFPRALLEPECARIGLSPRVVAEARDHAFDDGFGAVFEQVSAWIEGLG
jgi:pimeloyl-ACP methyl ester carboxylesterase